MGTEVGGGWEAPGMRGVRGTGPCTCSAMAIKDGAQTSCVLNNEAGSCPGTRICGPNGLSECTGQVPSPEACDGVDNDCDGSADEDFDADGDGFFSQLLCSYGDDCDDTEGTTYPDAPDGKDHAGPPPGLESLRQKIKQDDAAHRNEYEAVKSGKRPRAAPAQTVEHRNRAQDQHAPEKIKKP